MQNNIMVVFSQLLTESNALTIILVNAVEQQKYSFFILRSIYGPKEVIPVNFFILGITRLMIILVNNLEKLGQVWVSTR